MKQRYLTHFGTVLALHVLLLVGSVQLFQTDYVQNKIQKLGPHVIKMKVATEVLSQPLKRYVPTPAITPKVPSPARVVEAVPTDAVVSETTTSEASGEFDVKLSYKAELRARIDQNKFYPVISRRLGQTGVVVVAFTLLEDGNIINVRIDKPSPFERLNIAGMEAVKKVEKFKPIPKELGASRMDIKVPVKFYTI